MKIMSPKTLLRISQARETYLYIVFGILTTLVNFISYVFFTKVMPFDYKIAVTIAWVLSVLFAFVTNKLYVFNSKEMGGAKVVREGLSFLFFRWLSYFVDLFAMIILVEWLGAFDLAAKIAASAIVAALNYIASKYVIFVVKPGNGQNVTETDHGGMDEAIHCKDK